MNKKINIIGGNNITIQYGRDLKKKIKTSKSSFRISRVASNDVVIHLNGKIEFLASMTNVTVQENTAGSPVRLTPENWDSLTDSITEITGGAGGGGTPGVTPGEVASAIGTHNTSPTAHADIRTLIASLEFVKNAAYNSATGDLAFTFRDNSTLTVNILVANLVKGLDYDAATKEIVLTKNDSSTVRISVADLVDVYAGFNGAHIQTTVEPGNVIKAVLKAGTVTETELSAALLNKINAKADDVPAGTVNPKSRISSGWVDTESTSVTFAEASSRVNIASGESFITLFGKIRKWFSDLKSLAFKDKVDWNTDIENKPAIVTPTATEWGGIGGTLENQTDLKTVLDQKALKSEIAWIKIDSPSALTSVQKTDGSFDFNGLTFASVTALWAYMKGKQFNCDVQITLTQPVTADRVISDIRMSGAYILTIAYHGVPLHNYNLKYLNLDGRVKIDEYLDTSGEIIIENCRNFAFTGYVNQLTGRGTLRINSSNVMLGVDAGLSSLVYQLQEIIVSASSELHLIEGKTSVSSVTNYGLIVLGSLCSYSITGTLNQNGQTIDNRSGNPRDTFVRRKGRSIILDDNNTGGIQDDLTGDLSIPVWVKTATPVANSSQFPQTLMSSLRFVVQRILDNLAYLFYGMADRYSKTESDTKFEQVSRKDATVPQTPTPGNYPQTAAIKSYVDSLIAGIPAQLFFYSFDSGQFTAGAPSPPSGISLISGDELYNFADGKNWKWNGTSWDDITNSITKTPVDGSVAFVQQQFFDGAFSGHPGSVIYEIVGSAGTWHPFPVKITLPDDVTLEFLGNGAIGIKGGSVGSTQIASAVMALINGAVQAVAGKGLSTNDFDSDAKKKSDFLGSETASTLANMAITKNLVQVTASTNQMLSISSVSVQDVAFMIVVKASAAITVTVPASDLNYVNIFDTSYSLASGDYLYINAVYSGVESKYHLNAISK